MATELDHAKATLKRLLRKAHDGPSLSPGSRWTEEDDAELDWAINQIVQTAAERGKSTIT